MLAGGPYLTLAVRSGQAITFRFVCRGPGRWYVQATTDRPHVPIRTRRALGALGLDLNPRLVALAEIDRHGNPVGCHHLPYDLAGKTTRQARAILADLALLKMAVRRPGVGPRRWAGG